MTFHGIAIDERRVTTSGLVGDAEFTPTIGSLRIVGHRHVDISFCQVPDPAGATASTGIAPHLDQHPAQGAAPRTRRGSGAVTGFVDGGGVIRAPTTTSAEAKGDEPTERSAKDRSA